MPTRKTTRAAKAVSRPHAPNAASIARPVRRDASGRIRNFVNATVAKNNFGSMQKHVQTKGPVIIENHGQASAVLISKAAYDELLAPPDSAEQKVLDDFRAEFDALFERMQTEKARKAGETLFTASADDLRKAVGTTKRA